MGEPVRCLEALDGHDALRIYDDRRPSSGGPLDLSADMTLSEIVEHWYKPVKMIANDLRPRSYEATDGSVAYWVRFVTRGGAVPEPPLRAITRLHCADFIKGLKQLPGRDAATMSNNAINKHAAEIQKIINLCGPPDRKMPGALGLLDQLPYIERPRRHKTAKAENCFTLAEIERLIENADAANLKWDMPCSIAEYLRRLYRFTYYSGFRIISTMGARWSQYHGHYLILQAKVAVKGDEDKRIELSPMAQEIIESMRGCGPARRNKQNSAYDPDRIFAWPWAWPNSQSNLYKQHRKVVKCLPKNRWWAFHAERRATNNELARVDPKACEKVLGHKLGSVNNDAYTSREIAASGLSKMTKLKTSRDAQKRLFD